MLLLRLFGGVIAYLLGFVWVCLRCVLVYVGGFICVWLYGCCFLG